MISILRCRDRPHRRWAAGPDGDGAPNFRFLFLFPEGTEQRLLTGRYGFNAGSVSGKRIAELIATGRTPEILPPLRLSRFAEGRLVGEKAAAVSH